MAAARTLALAAADVMGPRVLGRRGGPLLVASPLDGPRPNVLGLLAPLLPFAAGAIYRDGPSIPVGRRREGGDQKPDDVYIAAGYASDAAKGKSAGVSASDANDDQGKYGKFAVFDDAKTFSTVWMPSVVIGRSALLEECLSATAASAVPYHAKNQPFVIVRIPSGIDGRSAVLETAASAVPDNAKNQPFVIVRIPSGVDGRSAVLEECLFATAASAVPDHAKNPPFVIVRIPSGVDGRSAVLEECLPVTAAVAKYLTTPAARALLEVEEWLWLPTAAGSPSMSMAMEALGAATCALWAPHPTALVTSASDEACIFLAGSLGEQSKNGHDVPRVVSGEVKGAVAISGGGRATGGRGGRGTGGGQGRGGGGRGGGRRRNNKPAWARGLERQMVQVKYTVLVIAKKLDHSIAETVSHRFTVKSVGQSLLVQLRMLPISAFLGEFVGFILGGVIVFKYGIPYLLGIIADEMINWFSELNLSMEDVDHFIEHVKDKMLEDVNLWRFVFGKRSRSHIHVKRPVSH